MGSIRELEKKKQAEKPLHGLQANMSKAVNMHLEKKRAQEAEVARVEQEKVAAEQAVASRRQQEQRVDRVRIENTIASLTPTAVQNPEVNVSTNSTDEAKRRQTRQQFTSRSTGGGSGIKI